MAYLHPLHAWISQAESHLTDQLERASSKGSRRSSKRSSRLSARERERVRLAELKAERSMLKQKQALRAAEEDLELELEIVKAEARGKALEELDREHNPPPPPPPRCHVVQVHYLLCILFPDCDTICSDIITQ